MRDMLITLLYPYGRIGRLRYAATFILAVITIFSLRKAVDFVPTHVKSNFAENLIIFTFYSILLFAVIAGWIVMVAVIKRCRDIGISPWWVLLQLLPITEALFILFFDKNLTKLNPMLMLMIVLISIVVQGGFDLYLGFRKGFLINRRYPLDEKDETG